MNFTASANVSHDMRSAQRDLGPERVSLLDEAVESPRIESRSGIRPRELATLRSALSRLLMALRQAALWGWSC